MALLKTISEQSSLGFTGRINILSKLNQEYTGQVCMQSGTIVYSQFLGESGEICLYLAIAHDLYFGGYDYVSEPEVIDKDYCLFELDVDTLRQNAKEFYQKFVNSYKFRPDKNLRIGIDSGFLKKGVNITSDEFHVLTLVSDFNNISDIFRNSKISESRCIMGLVSLREKKALRVFNKG